MCLLMWQKHGLTIVAERPLTFPAKPVSLPLAANLRQHGMQCPQYVVSVKGGDSGIRSLSPEILLKTFYAANPGPGFVVFTEQLNGTVDPTLSLSVDSMK